MKIKNNQLIYRIMSTQTEPLIFGVSSGFPEIEKLTNGWMKSDFILIDSFAKNEVTKMIVTLLQSTIKENLHSVVFTTNDTSKIISKQFSALLDRFECICVSDNLETNLHEIRMICRQFKRKKDTDIIVFDSLEMLVSLSNNIANCSKDSLTTIVLNELKQLALEINVPLIIYSNIMEGKTPTDLETMACYKSIINYVDVFGVLSKLKPNVLSHPKKTNEGSASSKLTIIKNNTGLIGDAIY